MSPRSHQIKEPILQDQSETHLPNSLPEADKQIGDAVTNMNSGLTRKRQISRVLIFETPKKKRFRLGMRGAAKMCATKKDTNNNKNNDRSKDDEKENTSAYDDEEEKEKEEEKEEKNINDSWYILQ